jgi:photosystem II stability/assembly factor-like uncharacterized protein
MKKDTFLKVLVAILLIVNIFCIINAEKSPQVEKDVIPDITLGTTNKSGTEKQLDKADEEVIPVGVDLYGITYNGRDRYVLVGENGMVAFSYSGDAKTWKKRLWHSKSNLYAVTYGGDKYVAVGEGGTIITSESGSEWQPGISPSKNTLYGIVWDGEKFVAVGEKATVLLSYDGLLWEEIKIDNLLCNFYGVSWNGNVFVAVGSYFGGRYEDGVVFTSVDGYQWIEPLEGASAIFSISPLKSIASDGKGFVAVSNNITGEGKMFSSPDGFSWEEVNTPVDGLRSIIWDNKYFLATGNRRTVVKSADGINWSKKVYQDLRLSTFYGIASSGNQYVVVGERGATLVDTSVE